MCGIAGFKGAGGKSALEKITNTLSYRGPDDSGFFIEGDVALGHRRLSIIDLKTGHQPMLDHAGKLSVVFNGEIYNFQKLKKDLEKKGHKFNTTSDTEVILSAYQEYGTECVKYFNGMFALALWDGKKKQLFLARDRMGQKPLYYTHQNGNFIFASELKAIIAHPEFQSELDRESARKYFYYEHVPAPHTILKDVYKLQEGESLTFKSGTITKNIYWDLDFSLRGLSLEDATEEFDKKMERAVKRRLISDVPLGIFLSGGIDSSTTAWYAQQNTRENIKTFSIAFEESSFDESEFARLVARHIGSEHHELPVSSKDAQNIIPSLPDIFDEPVADAGVLPQYLLARETKKFATVALSGDGGDEILAGYQTFQAEKIYQLYRKFPKFMRDLARGLAHMLPTSHKYLSFDFRAKKFTSAEEELNIRHQSWVASFRTDELDQLLQKANSKAIGGKLREFVCASAKDYLDETAAFYQRFYLPGKVLAMVDRSSMQHALEVRSPFLDHEVIEYLNGLPSVYKLRGGKVKFILKHLMRDRLPQEVLQREKQGFTVPLAEWFQGQLKNLLIETLSKENVMRAGVLNYSFVERLLNDHFARKANNGQRLWTLLTWQLWHNKYFS